MMNENIDLAMWLPIMKVLVNLAMWLPIMKALVNLLRLITVDYNLDNNKDITQTNSRLLHTLIGNTQESTHSFGYTRQHTDFEALIHQYTHEYTHTYTNKWTNWRSLFLL